MSPLHDLSRVEDNRIPLKKAQGVWYHGYGQMIEEGGEGMKKTGVVFLAVLVVLGLVLAFFAGSHMSNKAHAERRAEAFDHAISTAMETAEQKGLGTSGAAEFAASNLWVAHELCDSPEISAELSDLWNTLIYKKETYEGNEDRLIAQLENMLKK